MSKAIICSSVNLLFTRKSPHSKVNFLASIGPIFGGYREEFSQSAGTGTNWLKYESLDPAYVAPAVPGGPAYRPMFQVGFKPNSGEVIMHSAYRGGLPESVRASDVLADMILRLSNNNPGAVTKVVLHDVQRMENLYQLSNMAKSAVRKLGLDPGDISFFYTRSPNLAIEIPL